MGCSRTCQHPGVSLNSFFPKASPAVALSRDWSQRALSLPRRSCQGCPVLWLGNVEAETGTWHCRKVKDTVNGCELLAQAQSARGAAAPKDQSAVPLLHNHRTEGPVTPRASMEQDTLKLWSSRIKHEIFGGKKKKKTFSKAK